LAGHPSVKKRQKELARKERQQEKSVKRGERRVERNTTGEPGSEAVEGFALDDIEFALDEFGKPIIPEAFADMAKKLAPPAPVAEPTPATPTKRGD
jgi:hypothetical protein